MRAGIRKKTPDVFAIYPNSIKRGPKQFFEDVYSSRKILRLGQLRADSNPRFYHEKKTSKNSSSPLDPNVTAIASGGRVPFNFLEKSALKPKLLSKL